MKKKLNQGSSWLFDDLPKIVRVMKLIGVFMFAALLQVSASSYSQTKELTIKGNHLTLEELFEMIEDQSEFSFMYNLKQIDLSKEVDVDFKNQTVDKILNRVLADSDITFTINDRLIVIHKVKNAELSKQLAENQQRSISGKVTDSSGQPLPGVTVVLRGTTHGIITNGDGEYTLTNISDDAVLQFSFVGMKTQEISVSGKTIIDVIMVEETIGVDEVVVVGYGEMRRSDLTGSLSSVNVENSDKTGMSTVNQLLQGRAVGVEVKSNNGIPGAPSSIYIRGRSSMSTNSQPLFVIDNIIMDETSEELDGDNNLGIGNLNPFRNISPEDIESMEILKDASATAIYGARGANGVILITTKQGKSGKDRVTLSSSMGFSKVIKKLNVLSAYDYAQYVNELDGLTDRPDTAYNYFDENGVLVADSLITKDWQDEFFETGFQQNTRISISGGNNQSKHYFSVGYLTNSAVIPKVGFEKADIRLNHELKVRDWLLIKSNVTTSHSDTEFTSGTPRSTGLSMLASLYQTRPVLNTIVRKDGSVDDFDNYAMPLPYDWINNSQDETSQQSILANFEGIATLSKIFKFRTSIGYNYMNSRRKIYYGVRLYQGKPDGRGIHIDQTSSSYTWDNLLMFDKKFNDKHRVSGTIGVTYYTNKGYGSNISSTGFIDDLQMSDALQAGANQSINSTTENQYTYLSGLFRINYAFRNKLLITSTGRYDGVSKFAKGNQWGFFPSFATAYNLDREQFMRDLPFISRTKIRIGWGQVGNSSSPPYATKSLYDYRQSVNDEGKQVTTLVAATKGNPYLTWEHSEQGNLGLDLGLFDQRILLTTDVYHKVTKRQLQLISLPASSGFSNQWVNLGEVQNEGIEFDLNLNILRTSDWNISFGGNISINRNKILKIGLAPDEFGQVKYMGGMIASNRPLTTSANVFMEGKPIGLFWGYKTDGIIQEGDEDVPTFSGISLAPGDIKFVDRVSLSEDGVPDDPDGDVTPIDMTVIGDPNPDFTYGFSGEVSWKKISLNFLFNGVQGNDILNATISDISDMTNSIVGSNRYAPAYLNAWRPDKPSNTYPRILSNNAALYGIVTDRNIEDGSYLKLSQVTINYQINPKKFINQLEIYFTGQNLLYFTKYNGYSPEIPSSWANDVIGVDKNSFPDVRSYMLGLKIDF